MTNDNTPEWVKKQNEAWGDAIACEGIARAEGMGELRFIGRLDFPYSQKADRLTAPMSFETMCDWASSVDEFFRQAIAAGDYDGTEVIVRIYEYTEGTVHENLTKGKLIDSNVIDNPDYDGFEEVK